jgi:hypothetical protein
MAAQKLTHNRIFQMRVSAEFLALLDDWRRAQPDIPSRAQAVRNLVERAIAVDRAEKRGVKRH